MIRELGGWIDEDPCPGGAPWVQCNAGHIAEGIEYLDGVPGVRIRPRRMWQSQLFMERKYNMNLFNPESTC